ncbi:hypothetical protein JB92DRAFT_1395923 [Gautieria morchelliformis]|nr:hypothetical protein JB92DRAFT_1395923 [Gautieria morchelliformis]
MTSGRKPPHCKTCHKPLKGHKRGVCDLSHVPSSTAASAPPSHSKTQGPARPTLDKCASTSPRIQENWAQKIWRGA